MAHQIKVNYWRYSSGSEISDCWPVMVGMLKGNGHFKLLNRAGASHLHLVVSGQALIQSGDQERKVKRGDLFCFFKDQHASITEKETDPVTFYWISFSKQGSLQFPRFCGFNQEHPFLRASRQCVAFEKLFQQLHDAYGERCEANTAHLLVNLFKIGEKCRSLMPYWQHESTRLPKAKHLVDAALEMIEARLHERINVTELAESLGVSRNTLTLAFKKQRGMTPVDFVQSFRLNKAKQMLLATDYKMLTIADACGYTNEKYFHQCFRKSEGMTPRQYRLKNE